MLNISPNSIRERVPAAFKRTIDKTATTKVVRIFYIWGWVMLITIIVFMFMPWTQSVRGSGIVTNIKPENRPQTLQSPIPGRVVAWAVSEGDTVAAGDTLVYIAEVKDEYFDPNLMMRIGQELDAKELSAKAYEEKSEALTKQIDALIKTRELKLKQLTLKMQSDSADNYAAGVALRLARQQYNRADTLLKEGIKSQYEVEQRLQKLQEAQAKKTYTLNHYMQTATEINTIEAEYLEKISKAESDLYTAQSYLQGTHAEIAKLRSKRSSVEIRQGYYQITAPQNAIVSRALITGIGENIKEGTPLVELYPLSDDIAAEIWVRPMDLPLIQKGLHGQLMFDGWPTLAMSGWPGMNFGTFSAEVVAIANTPDSRGLYRVLLKPGEEWPRVLQYGSGTEGMILLGDVPVWYELWRQFNGFPADFYTPVKSDSPKN